MFAIETGQYEQDRQRAIVHNLYVVPEYRDQGIGTALLTATEDTFVDSDVDSLSLSVMASNDGAQRFYRRNGYAPHRVELEKSLESDTL